MKKLKQILIRKSGINKIIALFISLNILSAQAVITDSFVDETLDKELKIKTYSSPAIVDTFIESKDAKTFKDIKTSKPSSNKSRQEKITIQYEKAETRKSVESGDLKTPLQIRIEETFTTKKSQEEGKYINFLTVNDAEINGKLYPKGTIVKGRIETISQNSIWGIPADLVVGNFTINGIPLAGEISKQGANRLLWVRPVSIVVTLFAGVGIFMIFIRGGHAKIKLNEVYEIGSF